MTKGPEGWRYLGLFILIVLPAWLVGNFARAPHHAYNWGAATSVGQLILLAVAAVVAWTQVNDARLLREEQTRPFVVIDITTDDFLFFLTIENRGRTLARGLSFDVNPPFATSLDDQTFAQLSWFKTGIRSLAPGKKLSTLFDSSIQRDRKAMPDVYTVNVRYTDASGKHRFNEDQVLDLGVYWGMSRIKRKDVDDVHKALDAIGKTIAKWTADTSGLLVLSPDDQSERNSVRLRQFEELRDRQSSAKSHEDETETETRPQP